MLNKNYHQDISEVLLNPERLKYDMISKGNDRKPFWNLFNRYYLKKSSSTIKTHRNTIGVIDAKKVYPEWRFNHQMSTRERNCLLCIYAKMRHEGIWRSISSISWISPRAELDFYTKSSPQSLRINLLKKGYTDAWYAKATNNLWGLRSARAGVQLHFRGLKNGKVNVHIDSNNPSKGGSLYAGLKHLCYDSGEDTRNKTHSPAKLRHGLIKQGIFVPSVP
jgi:hypothetical protein